MSRGAAPSVIATLIRRKWTATGFAMMGRARWTGLFTGEFDRKNRIARSVARS
jgi:hypothetical protein